MEMFVYAVYLVGILAAFSALVVRVYALLPAELLTRGEHAGRFADLGAPQASRRAAVRRLTAIDVPRARTA